MGAWGAGAFENDTALDWVNGLEGTEDLVYIEAAFDKVLEVGSDYLEAPEAQEAIAAAESVARLQGHFGTRNDYTEAIDTWVTNVAIKPTDQLAQKAKRVLLRIQQHPSELQELFSESDDADAWAKSLSELTARINDVSS